jgi:hypothetical protein
MSIFRTTILIITVQLLSQCSDKKEIGFTSESLLTSQSSSRSQVIGDWKAIGTFMYSAKLTFKQNGTFEFFDRGCTGHSFTKGHWINNEETFFLTSLEEYRDPTPPSANVITFDSLKKENLSLLTFDSSFMKRTKPSSFNPSDTTDIYFENVVYKLEGDTLYRIDKTGLRSTTFIAEKNNR